MWSYVNLSPLRKWQPTPVLPQQRPICISRNRPSASKSKRNVTLFDRSGRLVRLTNAGQVFLSHVERILAQVENARVEMAEMAGGARGRCRLASLPTIAAYLLPRALATFQRRYPGVEVQLMEAVQLQLLEWVQQGTVDFSIVALPVQDPHLQSASLLHDDFVLVVPKDHDFAARRIVKLAELVTEHFILYPRGAGGREQFMEACRQVGFAPQVAFESEDRETILGLVAAGVGVTILPRIIAHHTRVDGPVMVDIVEPHLRREVGVVWRRNRYLPQSARNPIALLEDVVHNPV